MRLRCEAPSSNALRPTPTPSSPLAASSSREQIAHDQGLNLWKRFVADAEACLEDYNNKNKANFKYKISLDDIVVDIVEEATLYFHLIFLAGDKNGPKLFFGEIARSYDDELMKKQVVVPCYCPVSANAAGGRGFRSIADIPEDNLGPIKTNIRPCLV